MPDDKYRAKDHWRCLAACFLLSLSPFQYGIDFGLIGGMQAMVGFLKVGAAPYCQGSLLTTTRSLATRIPSRLLAGT